MSSRAHRHITAVFVVPDDPPCHAASPLPPNTPLSLGADQCFDKQTCLITPVHFTQHGGVAIPTALALQDEMLVAFPSSGGMRSLLPSPGHSPPASSCLWTCKGREVRSHLSELKTGHGGGLTCSRDTRKGRTNCLALGEQFSASLN